MFVCPTWVFWCEYLELPPEYAKWERKPTFSVCFIFPLVILIKTQLTRVLLKSSCTERFMLLDRGKESFGLKKAQGLHQATL